MKIKGRLLYFDEPDITGLKFHKKCKIDIPEKVPVTLGFASINDPDTVVGNATAKLDKRGIIFDADIDSRIAPLVNLRGDSGYFTDIKKYTNNAKIITKAKLRSIVLLNIKSVVHPDYKFEIVDDIKYIHKKLTLYDMCVDDIENKFITYMGIPIDEYFEASYGRKMTKLDKFLWYRKIR